MNSAPAVATAARHSDSGVIPSGRHLGKEHKAPRWVRWTAIVVGVALLAALCFAAFWFIRLQGNISKAPLNASSDGATSGVDDSKDRLQILIIGTDTRDGKNSQYGSTSDSTGFGNSDVMMLLDISADNKRVSVVSFPRDLIVKIPDCYDWKTKKIKAGVPAGQINSSMKDVGPGCTVDTINKLTGLQIDHFMMADFTAVKELSNTVGGVQVCVNAAIDDPDSGLKLPAGKSMVKGEQALAFLRNRHGVGDGSDLSRIKSQQAFLASLVRKIRSDGTLTNVPKMLEIADTVTKNLTVDDGLANAQSLLTIGNRLKDVDLNKVAFITVPWEPSPLNPDAWIQPKEPEAAQLFKAMREDLDLTNPKATTSPSATPSSTPSATSSTAASTPTSTTAAPTYDKAVQPIVVANGTTVPGRSQEITTFLAKGGFTQISELAVDETTQTTVYYGTGFADVARDVAVSLGIPTAQVEPSASVSGVQVYLGSDFTDGTSYKVSTVPTGIVGQTAAEQTCQSAYVG
ncbi:LCP family protein [Pseudarthrobacter sp. J1738]|uniref:LCP family protein n=1 Tax=unclassified Pseudarthrobacter TaxID=2647000 RepID=UPI003D2D4CBC